MNKLLAGPIIFSIRDSTPESELQINTSYILHTKIIYTSIRSSLISPAFMSNTIDYRLVKTKFLTTLKLFRILLSLQIHNANYLFSPIILSPSLILQHAHYNNCQIYTFQLYRCKLYLLLGSLFHEHILLYISTFPLGTYSLSILNSI